MEVLNERGSSSNKLHPITIITLVKSDGKRIATKALCDQCCTDKGLISQELVEELGIPAKDARHDQAYSTAAGVFSSNKEVELSSVMLPCLSNNRSFSTTLMVIPKECSSRLNYGVILGQEAMRELDLDTSVRTNTISWGEQEIPMVPRDYWTEERILKHKARIFNKSSQNHVDEVASDEDNTDLPSAMLLCLTPKIKINLLLE